jgi:GAF domain-containing protein
VARVEASLAVAPDVAVATDERPSVDATYRAAISAFSDVAAALGQLGEQDELLHLIESKLCDLVGVERCSVYLHDPATGLYRGQVGHPGSEVDHLVKRLVCGTDADGFTREIVETRAPVVVSNTLTDPRPVKSAMRFWKIRSMMGVPMLSDGEVVGIFFLDTGGRAHTFTQLDEQLAMVFAELAGVAIAQSTLFRELRSSHDTVARQNTMLRRAAAIEERLTNLVLDGCNLREIAEAVTELTHHACTIYDASHQRVAWARVPESGTEIPHLLDDEFRDVPEITAARRGLEDNRAAMVGPFAAAGLPHRFLVAPTLVRGERLATLVMMEQGTRARFSNSDLMIARRAATIIALELTAERRAAAAEWNARDALAADLLRGNRDRKDLESRAEFLGVCLDDPHVVCVITGREGDAQRLPHARKVAEAFRAEAPELTVLVTAGLDGVAVIAAVPADRSRPAGVETVKALARRVCVRLGEGRLIGGVSTVCSSPTGFARARDQAQQVVGCVATFCAPGVTHVCSADELGAGRLFLATTDATEVDRFVAETLGGLIGSGAPEELLATVDCFFREGRSVRRSATHLGVHENTIRYRLARVEEIIGLPIATDSDAQLSAQLALLVLRLRGQLAGFAPV